jgi:hypothetical protein
MFLYEGYDGFHSHVTGIPRFAPLNDRDGLALIKGSLGDRGTSANRGQQPNSEQGAQKSAII